MKRTPLFALSLLCLLSLSLLIACSNPTGSTSPSFPTTPPAVGVGNTINVNPSILTAGAATAQAFFKQATPGHGGASGGTTAATPPATTAPTPTPVPTHVVQPTPTPIPPRPTQPPAPKPTPTPPPSGVNGNPWGYNFVPGNLIYNPNPAFCNYFSCVSTFWTATRGYVVECVNGEYSHSGGVSGACSRDGGVAATLYSH